MLQRDGCDGIIIDCGWHTVITGGFAASPDSEWNCEGVQLCTWYVFI